MKGKELLSIKTIVAIGLGTAVYVILSRFASVPTPIPNTNIATCYGFLALIAVIFGPVAGFFVGLLGHALTDLIFYGSPWWSWVIPSSLIGLGVGLLSYRFKIADGEFGTKDIITFNIIQAIANAVAWFLVAPTLDILIYAEPADKVYTQGIVAGISNIVTVAIIGTLLILAYVKTIPKTGSLKKD